jgi:hypothetical protein
VAIKALLLYATAVAGFRLGERRALAEISAFDVIAAVAVGAIVGRVPTARDAGYLAGAVTDVNLVIHPAAVPLTATAAPGTRVEVCQMPVVDAFHPGNRSALRRDPAVRINRGMSLTKPSAAVVRSAAVKHVAAGSVGATAPGALASGCRLITSAIKSTRRIA